MISNKAKFNTMTIAKRKCKCGNLITFEKPYPATCKRCGDLVYPTKRMETIAKIKKEMKKKMNCFIGIGRITKKPELRYTTSNMAVVKFILAINRDTKNKQGEYETDFISCVAYNKTAELISKYLDKGSQLAIEGKIQTGSYEKDNKKIYTTDVVVERLTFLEKRATQSETQEATQTEIVQKAMNDNPYETMGQQVQTDLPF